MCFYVPPIYTTLAVVGFPGLNIPLGAILALMFGMPTVLTYTLFAYTMTRSGGDYVYISRTLHPLVGFMAGFSVSLEYMVFCGIQNGWGIVFGLVTMFTIQAELTGDAYWAGAAAALGSPVGIAAAGATLFIVIGLVVVSGTRNTFLCVQGIMMGSLLSFLGSLYLALTFPAEQFNAYWGMEGIKEAAYETLPFLSALDGQWNDWTMTIRYAMYMSWMYPIQAVGNIYQAGEIKGGGRTVLLSYIISSLVLVSAHTLMAEMIYYNTGGPEQFASWVFLSVVRPDLVPVATGPLPPTFYTIAFFAGRNIIMTAVCGSLLLVVFGATLPTCLAFACNRNWFAWSMDRVFPKKFSDIHPRFGVPVLTPWVLIIIGLVVLTLYAFTGAMAFTSILPLVFIAEYLILSVAGMVLPFRRKDIYKGSGGDKNIGKLPVITLVSVIGFIVYALVLADTFRDPAFYGATYALIPLAIFVAGIVLYAISYGIRRRQGININLCYSEIPPE
jgi:amino acid transporter